MMDVARLAGVSPQTVSCVLNDPESVRPVMREKVREAMAQLGYRRGSAARSPVAESTRTIGIVTAGSHFFGPASTVAAIEIAARRVSYASLVIALNRSLDDEVAEALHFLIARGVDVAVRCFLVNEFPLAASLPHRSWRNGQAIITASSSLPTLSRDGQTPGQTTERG